jgi:hypothetical protein
MAFSAYSSFVTRIPGRAELLEQTPPPRRAARAEVNAQAAELLAQAPSRIPGRAELLAQTPRRAAWVEEGDESTEDGSHYRLNGEDEERLFGFAWAYQQATAG